MTNVINNMIPTSGDITIDQTVIDSGIGGYEFTGGFADRFVGSTSVDAVGSNVAYTQAMADNEDWLRFGFSTARQLANDAPYWGDNADDPNEAPHSGSTDYQGVGLFGGAYMPAGVTALFAFDDNTAYNQADTASPLTYNAAGGSYDFSQCNAGDFTQIRFDFNAIPQFANTTLEVGLIWSTRDSNDNITFTFPLLTSPIYFGSGSVGKVYLNRPLITAYMASAEDVNARALPAIRANNPILIQPLTTLCTIKR